MSFLLANDEIFMLSTTVTAASANVKTEDERSADCQPLVCEVSFHSPDKNRATAKLRWSTISRERRERGDLVDFVLEIRRSKPGISGESVDIRLPVRADDVYDSTFGAVAAASARVLTPSLVRGCELLVGVREGALLGKAFLGNPVSHAATGYHFRSIPNAPYVSIRIHLEPSTHVDDVAQIRIGRVFFGLDYDCYTYNPIFEYRKYMQDCTKPADFDKISDNFISEAQKISLSSKFITSQSFIKPFYVYREGRPRFPMLVGTVNSLFWYALDTDHLLEMYEDMGFVVEGDVVLDCGAHAGQMSTYFALKAGPSGRVYAFDPFPQNYLQIEAQAQLNGLENLISTRAGVGEKDGMLAVGNAGQMTIENGVGSAADSTRIKIEALDNYLAMKPTALKLDIEGAEVNALHGAQRILTECRPKIFAEIHTVLIEKFGFKVADFFRAIPHELYDIWYIEERVSKGWTLYDGNPNKMVWKNDGAVKAFPKR